MSVIDWTTWQEPLQHALRVWDAWCLDDGRVSAAFKAAQTYSTTPTVDNQIKLEAALVTGSAACEMARVRSVYTPEDPAARYAYMAALAVLCWGWGWLDRRGLRARNEEIRQYCAFLTRHSGVAS